MKVNTFLAGILICSPVAGLTPFLAFLWTTLNVPNPTSCTGAFLAPFDTAFNVAFRAARSFCRYRNAGRMRFAIIRIVQIIKGTGIRVSNKSFTFIPASTMDTPIRSITVTRVSGI